MPTLTIATSVSRSNSLALAASTIQTLSEKEKALTQRVDALRAELHALSTAHATTIASLQEEQKKLDLSITDQQTRNAVLQKQNNELSKKATRYQTEFAAHSCPRGALGRTQGRLFNALRGLAREQRQSMERFLDLLKLLNP